MAELKPCPFCGGEEIAWTIYLNYATIGCVNCRASIKADGRLFSRLENARNHYEPKLLKAWNRRAEPQNLFDAVCNIDWGAKCE